MRRGCRVTFKIFLRHEGKKTFKYVIKNKIIDYRGTLTKNPFTSGPDMIKC